MKTITWIEFRDIVLPRFTTKNCDIKRAIHQQLNNLENKNPEYSWIDFAIAAKEFCYLKRTPTSEFRGNLSQGRGSKEIAAGIYFWSHSVIGLEEYALSVDHVMLDGKSFAEYFPNLKIQKTTKFDDFDKPLAFLDNSLVELISPEMELLKDILENVDIKNSRDLAPIILLNQVEDIMNSSTVLFDGHADLYQLRNSFGQVTNWVEQERVDKSSTNSFEWTVTYPLKEKKLNILKNGFNFVLIRPDGTRVASSALHAINSWLVSIWKLLHDKVIKPKDIQVIIRYILIFASCHRSSFMKMYFSDDAAKIDIVIRMAIEQAAIAGINLLDYNPIDEEYLHHYNAVRPY